MRQIEKRTCRNTKVSGHRQLHAFLNFITIWKFPRYKTEKTGYFMQDSSRFTRGFFLFLTISLQSSTRDNFNLCFSSSNPPKSFCFTFLTLWDTYPQKSHPLSRSTFPSAPSLAHFSFSHSHRTDV